MGFDTLALNCMDPSFYTTENIHRFSSIFSVIHNVISWALTLLWGNEAVIASFKVFQPGWISYCCISWNLLRVTNCQVASHCACYSVTCGRAVVAYCFLWVCYLILVLSYTGKPKCLYMSKLLERPRFQITSLSTSHLSDYCWYQEDIIQAVPFYHSIMVHWT